MKQHFSKPGTVTTSERSQRGSGDRVMIRRNKVEDTLSPRFDGPFEVVQRRGPNVKLHLRRKDKWVHLNHVKRYSGTEPTIVTADHAAATVRGEIHFQGSEVGPIEDPDEETQIAGLEGANSNDDVESATGAERRYPDRSRRPPKRFTDFVPWGPDSPGSESDSEPEAVQVLS